jgi:serine protease
MKFSLLFTLFALATARQVIVINPPQSVNIEIGEQINIGDTSFHIFDDKDIPYTSIPNFEFLDYESIVSVQNVYQWGLDRIDQSLQPLDKTQYQPEYTGKGIDIYVLDTGIDTTHIEFDGRAFYGTHFQDKKGDVFGHGTHVASTAVGMNIGVATGANVIDVKVLGDTGSGSTFNVIRGLSWAVERAKKTKRCSIISMSLGGSKSTSMDRAVDAAWESGVIVVVAAGNSNSDADYYSPARAEHALTVGSTDDKDGRSYFSNHGKLVDVHAPGSYIYGSLANSKDKYKILSGTSMATPHVAGTVAQIMEKSGCANIISVRNILLSTASKDQIKNAKPDTPNLIINIPVSDSTKKPTPNPTERPTKATRSPTPVPTGSPTPPPVICKGLPCWINCLLNNSSREACLNVKECKCRWTKRKKNKCREA